MAATGAEVIDGSLEDLDGLRCAAAELDGVIHLAFNHDFSKFVANCEDDRRVIAALGVALDGSDRPLIVTSGTLIAHNASGGPATEADAVLNSEAHPRAASEEAAASRRRQGRQRIRCAPSSGARYGPAGPHHLGDRDSA